MKQALLKELKPSRELRLINLKYWRSIFVEGLEERLVLDSAVAFDCED